MDPFSHTLINRWVIGKERRIIFSGLAADAPFFLVYPAYVVKLGQFRHALTHNEWPLPPSWLITLHHTFHSLPVTLAGALVVWVVTRRWPGEELAAWTLHILIDIPTHRREPWGPRFLWPLADVAVDGFLWVDGLFCLVSRLRRKKKPELQGKTL